MTDGQSRTLTIPFDFLSPNQRYQAQIYGDAAPRSVAMDTLAVTAATTLLPSGGYVAWLTPTNRK